jgi:SsrA-binding protein
MSKKKSSKKPDHFIVVNKKAQHDFFLEERFEAGLVLEGWEVKSLRAGRVQLRDSYVVLKNGEAWLLGALITPLPTAATHTEPNAQRTRKLLLNQKELSRLFAGTQREGSTVVPVNLHWTRNRVKVDIALAHGKKQHDKRETIKEREWNREKHRILKR